MAERINRHSAEVEAANARMRAFLDNIPDMAWIKDSGGRFVAVNRPLTEAFGQALPVDLIGKTDFDFVPPTIAHGYRKDDLEVMRTGTCKRIDEALVKPDGTTCTIETIKGPFLDSQGRVVGTVGIARDVTKRRAIEETLRNTAAHLDMLLSSVNATVFRSTCSINGPRMEITFQGADDRTADLNVMSVAELRTKVIADDQTNMFDTVGRELGARGSAEQVVRWIGDDGNIRSLLVRERVVSRGVRTVVTEGLTIDISDEIETRQRLQNIIANLPATIFRIHYPAEGRPRMVFVEGKLARRQGITRDALLGEGWLAFIHPQDRDKVQIDMPHRLRIHEEAESLVRIIPPDGSTYRWLRIWERVVERNGDEFYTEGVSLDVTAEIEDRRTVEAIIDNLPCTLFRIHYPAGAPKRMLFMAGQALLPNDVSALPPDVFLGLFHPDDRERLFVELPRQLIAQGSVVHEFRIRQADGGYRWVRAWERVVSRDGDDFYTEGITLDVTDEVNSRRTLQTLVDNLPGQVFRIVYPADGPKRLVFVGGKANLHSGLTHDELMTAPPETFIDLFHPDDREELFFGLPERLKRDGKVSHEFRIKNIDGSWHWQRVWEQVVERNGDEFVTEGITLDVTAEMQAKQALEASELEFRTLAENSPNLIMRYDRDCRRTYTNPAYHRSTGITPEESRGRSPTQGRWPATPSAEEYEAIMHRVMDSGEPAQFMMAWTTDGAESTHSVQFLPECDPRGQIVGCLAIAHDVTALRKAERRLQALVDNLPGRTYRYTMRSDGGRQLVYTGGGGRTDPLRTVAAEGFTIRPGGDLFFIHPDDRQMARAELARQLAERNDFEVRYRSQMPDGSVRWIMNRGAAVARTEQETILEGLILDITEEMSAKQALEASERHLHQAQKMEALGQLAGSVAHDFNNLLGAILGFANFIEEDAPPGTPTRTYAGHILSAGRRGKALIAQILSFARKGDFKRGNFSLAPWLAEVMALLKATIPSTTQVSFETRTSGDEVVEGDRDQLTQVLMNLAINAHDAIGGKAGTVVVSVLPSRFAAADAPHVFDDRSHAPERPAPFLVWEDEDGAAHAVAGSIDPTKPHVSLVVTDTGCGMDAKLLENVFAPFFTTKDRGHGTGLGLSTVHGTIIGHGGAIVVTSRPGAGTAFEVVLPCGVKAKAPSLELPAAPPHAPTVVPRGGLLLVDDDPDFGEMMLAALERRGYEVSPCSDPLEALEAVREHREFWDIVVTDQTMPGMTGLDLIREIKAIRPDLPCVLCTGYTHNSLDEDALARAGVASFLRKPIDVEELMATLAALLSTKE
jgi:PAS domain S-box-containing protein